MTPEKLQELLRKSWTRETSAKPEDWSPENPAWGQCAVSAVVGWDLLGGKIVRTQRKMIIEKNGKMIYQGNHYWNLLPDGREIDFTKEQFPLNTPIPEAKPITKDYILSFAPTRKRYALLRLEVENLIRPNPLLSDQMYQRCFEAALTSKCQKMKFACLVFYRQGSKEKLVVATANKIIEPLKDFCQPECIRFKIQSRTESMLGACGHAEEWALWEIIKLKIPPEKCSFYIAGFDAKNSQPWIKKEKVHTCLRCAVQMYMAKVDKIYVPVIDRWEFLTPEQALKTAKEYALGEKVTEKYPR